MQGMIGLTVDSIEPCSFLDKWNAFSHPGPGDRKLKIR